MPSKQRDFELKQELGLGLDFDLEINSDLVSNLCSDFDWVLDSNLDLGLVLDFGLSLDFGLGFDLVLDSSGLLTKHDLWINVPTDAFSTFSLDDRRPVETRWSLKNSWVEYC